MEGGLLIGEDGLVKTGGSAVASDWVPAISPTYNNPVLPGDHPDMSLYREGDDFYITGSFFHMAPNVEILHSRDLVRWERVSRVVDPGWSGLRSSSDYGAPQRLRTS